MCIRDRSQGRLRRYSTFHNCDCDTCSKGVQFIGAGALACTFGGSSHLYVSCNASSIQILLCWLIAAFICRTTIPGAIDVVFCSDQSADSWIVKEVETIRREGKVPHVRLCSQTISCCVPPPFCISLGFMRSASTFDIIVDQCEHQAGGSAISVTCIVDAYIVACITSVPECHPTCQWLCCHTLYSICMHACMPTTCIA